MSQNHEIRPNLFIIGAAKSGTTSLHDHLQRHPDIFMSEPKEPGYFTPDVGYYPTSTDWYLSLFQDAGDAKIVGESSTHYTKQPKHPGVPERIAGFCDSPRFIYLMRDPIDRIISQYWHEVRLEQQYRGILTAIKREAEFTALSDYAMQLEPYFATFGRDRVLALTFEELVAEPTQVLGGVFAWLGVDASLAPPDLERKNARPETLMTPTGLAILQRFRQSQLWDRMAQHVPKPLRRFGHRLARRPLRSEEVPVDEVIDFLRPTQQAKVRELSGLLGREFPLWTTTLG